MTNAADTIIVALDVATKEKALEVVDQLRDQISFFKIGLQLYTAEGPEIVRAVLSTGARVWLDIKLHDIPNTVARAVESANSLGVHGGCTLPLVEIGLEPLDRLRALLGNTAPRHDPA